MGYDFDVRVLKSGESTARVVVRGEIDMSVAQMVSTAVSAALRTDGISLVEVDLSAVHFLDASGVTALLTARNHAEAMDKTFRLRGANGLPLHVLEITGVLGTLSGKSTEDA